MATKRKAKERVQNYPDLFGELEGISFGGSLSTTNKARRSRNASQVHNWKGREQSSRERRNTRLWDTLYPTPNKTREG